MNASELADRLEYWREKIVESQSIDDDKLSTSAFASVAFNYAKVILKSLRFAADMERLMDCKDREIVFRKLSRQTSGVLVVERECRAVPTEWDAEIACEEEEGRIPFYETVRDLMLAGF
jgi:hypothetical protein